MKDGEVKAAIESLSESTKELTLFFLSIVELDAKSSDFDSLYEKMDKETLLVKIVCELAVAHDRLAAAYLLDSRANEAMESLKVAVAATKSLSTELLPTQNNGLIAEHFAEAQRQLGQTSPSFEEFFASIPPA